MRSKQTKAFRNLRLKNGVLAVLALTAVLVLPGEVSAQQQGTAEQRHACTPDVFRLCRAYIPNRKRITACLEHHRRLLSPECQLVFAH
ncbi:hypothetical protein CWB41_11880 [Methylovirgula ligni]|uniref:Cysteine rich repeat protein n=1 Tax=Methylovirgula ligni TaxID=569860 RepID=A0A3D9YTK0_9HYPH|nr:hypothetical protein CWB41_11880 [Methylovirgula ligni]REF85940.1 hypothetical protein DES32_1980 [Methylovirgula ligni]